ncbi:MAG: hypothetical protein K9J16_08285 [Melioribacteraceae bacterium]|nr:hypothetical protein [Melioribacteraceae bacterium]MCF8353178.1 hypothetical protein [Melioribacteraceae bacterium]MCF8395158.1 hypothetical protein [Melioribacteraceae bacterium]MCF8418025.1 hypothetical protein [Melioribacteraceae bacterium]
MKLYNYENGWIISERQFSIENNPAVEGAFTQGSGYLHIRGSLEEHIIDAPQNVSYLRMPANVSAEKFRTNKCKWGAYIPGIYCKHPTLNNELINLPFVIGLSPVVNGERFDLTKSKVSNYSRRLNLFNAVLTRELIWHTESGSDVKLVFERFVSSSNENCVFQLLEIESADDIEIEIVAGIDTDVRTNGFDHFTNVSFDQLGTNTMSAVLETDGNHSIEIVSELIAENVKWEYLLGKRKAQLTGKIKLNGGNNIRFEKRTCFTSSIDLQKRNSMQTLQEIKEKSFDQLIDEHSAIWKNRWERSDVVIEGDDEAQAAMRFSIYHLLRAHAGNDSRVAIDAKGYAGDAYWGRFFWDTEMYLLPFFSLTNPVKAKTLTDYRLQSLKGAIKNAGNYGYPGAKFAWESDAEGNECCPNWHYADHEIHITADVIYGLMYFSKIISGENYLLENASETIIESIKYLVERIDWSKGLNNPQILGVMGPDEYKPFVNNNFYTNYLIKFVMKNIYSNKKLLAKISDEKLVEKIKCAAEYLPVRKNEDGVWMQCDDFENFEEPQFENFWKDRTKPFASQVSQERIYRVKALKQADVLMAMFLFPQNFSINEIEKAYNYYQKYTTHDSSLSYGIHSIAASILGKKEDAWKYWELCSRIDIEGGTSEGIHIANAGAVWMVFVFGFAGLNSPIFSDHLRFNPLLPNQLQSVSFPLVWHGHDVFVELNHSAMIVVNKSSVELKVQVNGDIKLISKNSSQKYLIKE